MIFTIDISSNNYTTLCSLSLIGSLESEDDFYILNSGLVMLQTTNNIFNTSLYEMVKPQALLAWHRVRVAHHMANSGKEWANVFSKFNSGNVLIKI